MRNAKQESKTIKFETDEQVIKRIATRFNILHDMTKAVIAGDVRAMIVTGPPGVGKTTLARLISKALKRVSKINEMTIHGLINQDLALLKKAKNNVNKLETEIPYFADRTYGVLPGITGLAQVNQGYDTCIDDVRRKVGFDHSYALSLGSLKSWILMDLTIISRTLVVMIDGRGR